MTLLAAFALTAALTPVSIALARRWGVLDLPSPRKTHPQPTPRWGGLAVFAGWAGAVLAAGGRAQAPLAAAAGLVCAVGAADDKRSLPAEVRLAAHLAAACAVVACSPPAGLEFSPWADRALAAAAVVWIAGMASAVNCLDGADGAAASLGAASAAGLAALLGPAGPAAIPGLALAGACLGFLPYNWRPARVFLGDCGSTSIGFLLGAVSLRLIDPARPASWAAVGAALAIPAADMALTTATRLRGGQVRTFRQWLSAAGADHIPHRLADLGLSPSQVAGALAAGAGACALAAGALLALRPS